MYRGVFLNQSCLSRLWFNRTMWILSLKRVKMVYIYRLGCHSASERKRWNGITIRDNPCVFPSSRFVSNVHQADLNIVSAFRTQHAIQCTPLRSTPSTSVHRPRIRYPPREHRAWSVPCKSEKRIERATMFLQCEWVNKPETTVVFHDRLQTI